MDTVSKMLTDWGFESLIETFLSHQIDEEALLLLDRASLRAIVPQIGVCLKVEKKISDYKKERETENEITTPIQETPIIASDVNNSTHNDPINIPSTSNSSGINFDITAVVFDKCQEIGEQLKLGNSISYLAKLKLSRVLMKHCLVEKCGVFPTTQEKEELARQIVATFPPLKGLDGTGYEQWFCRGITSKDSKTTPNRGYLEESIRNWRQRLSATDKAKYGIKTYRKSADKKIPVSITSPTTEIALRSLEKQQWLKENSSPDTVVLQYMVDTCLERHQHILATNPSITQTLEAWPKLLDINLIDQDFATIFSQQECNSLCKEFGLVARSLIIQAKNCGRLAAEKYALSLLSDISDLVDSELLVSSAEINAALLLLPYLLPQGIVNGRKKFRPTLEQTKKHFIDELPEGSNIEELITTRTAEDRTRTQPFIVMTGNKFNPADIYIILENAAIQMNSLLKAVDTCFKLHFLFNVEYSSACSNIWKFLNTTFYKVDNHKATSSAVPSCVKELRARLFV